MPEGNILILHSDSNLGAMIERTLRSADFEVTLVADAKTAESLIQASTVDLLILGEQFAEGCGIEFGKKILERHPALIMILIAVQPSAAFMTRVIRSGFTDCLFPPLRADELIEAVKKGLLRRKQLVEWSVIEARRNTKMLQKRVDGLEALQQVGRSVTSLLDLDNILTTVVNAAVELTGAEEGSLLLLDDATGELYMRAARNFQDEFVRKFRLPIRDSLAGQVVRTGKPMAINEKTPQKIITAYLVHTLIYVPLQVHGRVIGVLGVDNRQSSHPFMDEHQTMVSTLADYAAIAIENARAYTHMDVERKKLETILTRVEDGVIVVDAEGRLLLANRTAQEIFHIEDVNLMGRFIQDVVHHPDLMEIFNDHRDHPSRSEIGLDDGRVFNAQVTPIPELGLAVTMQDITYLKELDRIKSDFVQTVSHDLRSPLTAILGYVELIDRAGPVTEQQRDFIRRIQFSVHNITNLINELLDLGRIEAGFDTRKEIAPIGALVEHAVASLRSRIAEKGQFLSVEIQPNLPAVFGNPVRLQQVITNLVGNASKYTQNKGSISVQVRAEEQQILLQVRDDGPGILPTDQPYIFDKFYRGSNLPADVPGTGLGLAIVRSIVENHGGRIWVESAPGQGSTFTVVLPVVEQSL